MADIVGSAEVQVGVDTAAAEAGLRRLQADFDRSMAAIDRADAQAKIGADTAKLDRAILEAKKRLKQLDDYTANPNIDVDGLTKANAEIEATKKNLKSLNDQKAEITVQTKELRAANTLLGQASKRQQEMARQSDRIAANDAKNAKIRERAAASEAKALQDRGRMQARAIEDDRKLGENRLKELVQIQRLRQEYSRLAGEQRKLTKTGRPAGIFRTASEIRDLERVGAEMELTRHRLAALGRGVDDLDPTLEDHQGQLSRWFTSLSKVRVQMGPLSGTLKQIGIGFVGLGPIIIGLAGSVSSLVGVLGTGLAGALATGIGAMDGFGLSALGIGMALRPVIKDLSAAEKATAAYNDAVTKYGKGSSQAKDKLDQLHTTMQNISPVARTAVREFVGLQAQWTKMTSGVRQPLFQTFAEGIKTAKALLPTFARQTVSTFRTLSQGTNQWLKDLRSPETKSAINQLMGNFRAGLPDLMAGLGNIAGIFTRIGVSASKLWPSLMHGFRGWTEEMSQAVGSGTELDGKIARLVDHMRSLGHFAQATGRLLITFFNTGADSGKDLLDTFTATENRWSDWMQSVEGQHSLRDWFSESETTTKEFFSVLGGISKLLFEVGRATAPLVQGLLRVVTVVGDVVDVLTSLGPTRVLLTGLGTALGVAFAASKVLTFTRAIKDAATALRGLSVVQGGLDLLGMGGLGAGGAKGTVTTVEEMERSLAGLPPAAAAAGTGFTLMGAVGVAAVGGLTYAIVDSINSAKDFDRQLDDIQKTLGGFVSHDNNFGLGELEDLNRVTKEQRQYAKQLVPANQAWKQSVLDVKFAQQGLAAAIKQNGRGSLQAQQAALNLRAAQSALGKETLQYKIQAAQAFDSASDRVNKAKASVDKYTSGLRQVRNEVRQTYNANKDDYAQAGKAIGPFSMWLKQNEDYVTLLREQTSAEQRLEQAQNQKAGEMLNFQRILKGSKPLTDQATMAAGKFVRQWGRVQGAQAKRLVLGADNSGAVTKLQRTSQLLNRVDGKKATVDILGSSKNAEQAARRVEARLRNVANQRYQAELTAEDKASQKGDLMHHHLQADAGAKYQATLDAIDKASGKSKDAKSAIDRFTGGRYSAKIDADTSAAKSAISQINAQLNALNGKTATTHTYNYVTTVYQTKGSPAGRAAGGPMPIPKSADANAKQINTGGKVTRPQYVVGEEAPRWNEWIVTENPAHREANKGYLASAADSLGMTVTGYKQGGHHKPPKKKGSKGPHVTAPTPHGQGPKTGNTPYDYWTGQVDYWDGMYSNERSNEEAYFAPDATGIPAYNYAKLDNYLGNEIDAYNKLIQNILPGMIKHQGFGARKATIKKANAFKDKEIAKLKAKIIPNAQKEYAHAKKLAKDHPNSQKLQNDADTAKAKLDRYTQKLKDDKAAQKDKVREANSTVRGLNQQIGDWQRELNYTLPNAKDAVVNERKQLADTKAGIINNNTSTSGGGTAETIAAQQFTASGAMLELYRSFGSNVYGSSVPVMRGTSPAAGGSGGGSAGSVASSAALGDSAGPSGARSAGLSGGGSDSGGSQGGTTINQTMNFAAPPPDPHTWSKNALFEIGAAA